MVCSCTHSDFTCDQFCVINLVWPNNECFHQWITTITYYTLIQLQYYHLSSIVNLVLGPVNSILTVRDVVLPDPLAIILASLCGDLNNPGWAFKVDLNPLIPRAVFHWPRPNKAPPLAMVQTCKPWTMVTIEPWRSSNLAVANPAVLHTKGLVATRSCNFCRRL